RAVEGERPDAARAVVAVDVAPLQRGRVRSPVDEAARDRLPLRPAVFPDGQRQALGRTARRRLVAVPPFHDVPPVVAAAGDDVDLFVRALPDVGHPEPARRRVEAEAPGVAQAVGEDLLAVTLRVSRERVVRRDAVAAPAGGPVDVEAEDGAEEGGRVLAVPLRVAAQAAVAEGDVEVAVGAEARLA